MAGTSYGFLRKDQQGRNHDHGRNQENLTAEQNEGYGGGADTDDGGNMVSGAEPLLHEHGDEQGSQNEFNTLKVDWEQRTGQTAQHTADDPVDLVKQGDPEAVFLSFFLWLILRLADQGISLVRQGKDHIEGLCAHALIGFQHRDTVKKMAGVDQQCGDGRGQQGSAGGQQADSQILTGACIHEHRHKKGPDKAVALFVQQNTEAHAQEQVAGQHGNRIDESGFDCGIFHGDHLSFG